MVVISSTVLFTWLLLACETTTAPQAEDLIHAREKNEHLGRRAVTLLNDGVHTLPTPSPTKPLTIISVPIGGPVTVTAQRQMVQSYVPLMIVCPLDVSPTSLSGPLISDPLTAASNRTDSNSTIGAALPPAPAIPAGAKYLLPRHHVWDCSTSYASFLTPVCATTLSPLAAPLIPVTACDQNVTFSSEYGYSLSPFTEPPALNPSMVRRQEESDPIETLTTYYVAPWYELIPGALPTEPVEAVICRKRGCTTFTRTWSTIANETLTTAASTVHVQGQVTGPANIIIGSGLTTITHSGSEPTSISLSRVVQTTATSTVISVVKTSAPTAFKDPLETAAYSSPVPFAEVWTQPGLGNEITTTAYRTTTRTVVLVTASGGGGGAYGNASLGG